MKNAKQPWHCQACKRLSGVLLTVCFSFVLANTALSSTNAAQNGGWISVGIPSFMHLGTQGAFYLNGTDQGTCGGVQPTYFRFDTNQPHWKEMYALIQVSSANERPMDCVVDSGCGTTEVWVSYCRTPLR